LVPGTHFEALETSFQRVPLACLRQFGANISFLDFFSKFPQLIDVDTRLGSFKKLYCFMGLIQIVE
jgi:hypothetical protein